MTEENEQAGEMPITTDKPSSAKPINVNDVDSTWTGKGSLDEHRQKAFAAVKQPGFGNLGKAKSDG